MPRPGEFDPSEALRRSEERCSAFIGNSSEAIWLFELEEPVPTSLPVTAQIDAFYRLAFLADCNEAMARLYGYRRPDELIGMRLGQLMPQDNRANVAFLQAFITAGHQLSDAESVELAKDGSLKHVLNSLKAVVENGCVLRAWGTSRDITAMKETEQRLRESESRVRLIVESATDFAIFTLDLDRRVTSWNVGAEKILGYPPAEIIGQPGDVLFTPEDRAKGDPQKETQTAAEVGRAANERWHVKKNGERFWGSGLTMPMRGPRNAVEGFLKIMRDATAAREADELRRRHTADIERLNASLEQRVQERTAALSEANAHLRGFAHTVAHDLRSPLRTVHEFSAILLSDHASQLPPEGRAMLLRIQAASDRMDALLSSILEYSRTLAADLVLEPIALGPLVAELIERYEPQIRERAAAVQVAPALPTLMAHRALLTQAVENLFTNALKFVPRQRQPEITFFGEVVGECARLCIRDNGIGVAHEDREKIFALFERARPQSEYPGTGVGLAIVHAAATRMGGSIGVDSTPGRGSTFWIELALPQAAEPGPTPRLAQPAA